MIDLICSFNSVTLQNSKIANRRQFNAINFQTTLSYSPISVTSLIERENDDLRYMY